MTVFDVRFPSNHFGVAQAARLSGAPEGSTIELVFVHGQGIDKDAGPEFGQKYRSKWTIRVINDTYFDEPMLLELRVSWTHQLVLMIKNVSIRASMRGQGLCREMTRRIVEEAHRLGVAMIGLIAAYKMSDGTPIAGLDAWPKCGFTGGIVARDHVQDAIAAGVPIHIRELPADGQGLQWHKDREHVFFLTFDVTPGSESWQQLDRRLLRDGGAGLIVGEPRNQESKVSGHTDSLDRTANSSAYQRFELWSAECSRRGVRFLPTQVMRKIYLDAGL